MNSIWKRGLAFLPVVVFALAIGLLHHEVSQYHWRDIQTSLISIAGEKIALASVLTLLNFMVLIGYDWIALAAIGRRLPLMKVAFASFTGFVASYNFGATLGGVPIRYRVYSAYGLSSIEILQLTVMLGITFWVGEFTLAGIAFVCSPIAVPSKLQLPFTSVFGLGWILLAVSVAYFSAILFLPRPMRLGSREFLLPSPGTTLAQISVAACDFLFASAAMYALLPNGIGVSYLQFLCVFLLASVAVVITHVPGGLGIFELVILTMLGAEASGDVVASLLVFRVIYYLAPLLVAVVMVACFEYRQHQKRLRPALTQLSLAASAIAPSLISGVVFVGGAVLLMSGATPSVEDRLQLLYRWIPLPFVELSHFVGSLVGVAMLVVARGLQRKLDSAWWLATSLSIVGIVTSIVKGFDFEEAILLGLALLVLVVSRKSFYRKGFLLHQRFTPGWMVAIGIVILCSIWLGVFAFKHVEYQHELWWQFTFQADAPRFLRASVGVATALLCVVIWSISKRTRPRKEERISDEDWATMEAVIRSSPKTNAQLGYLGDKQFLFSDDRQSFIMYAIQKRSWIAMGDPVGATEQFAELIWKFRETCDRYDGWPVFYQVDKQFLSLYLDQGLTLLKIGEEARVRLQAFSLEGQHKSLRSNRSKLQKAGYSFEVIPADRFSEIGPQLRCISDEWLAEKKTSEKGFSLGFFSEAYLQRYPIAVVKHEHQIVAFANLWQAVDKAELSIDLMRHRTESPNGLMDFLFTELLLWGKAEGYQWFNLGMAPLSGLANRPLAPLWNKAIDFVYRHGDQFYSFGGLRHYKQKFDPVWEPKYIATVGGLSLPRILTDLMQLIGEKKN